MTPAEEALRRTRRELRDALAGNTPFHQDEWAKKPDPVPAEEKKPEHYMDYLKRIGDAQRAAHTPEKKDEQEDDDYTGYGVWGGY